MKNKVLIIAFLVAFVVLFKPHVEFNITTDNQSSEVSSNDDDCECEVDNVDTSQKDKLVAKHDEAH